MEQGFDNIIQVQCLSHKLSFLSYTISLSNISSVQSYLMNSLYLHNYSFTATLIIQVDVPRHSQSTYTSHLVLVCATWVLLPSHKLYHSQKNMQLIMGQSRARNYTPLRCHQSAEEQHSQHLQSSIAEIRSMQRLITGYYASHNASLNASHFTVTKKAGKNTLHFSLHSPG